MKPALVALPAMAAALLCAPLLPATAQSASQADGASTGQTLDDLPSAFRGPGRRESWHADVVRTPRGHLIGNPEAEARLIMFVRYSDPASHAFLREGDGALDLALLAPGHLSVEIRPLITNAIDLTVAMLAGCGEASGFKDRHRLYLSTQQRWLDEVRRSPVRRDMLSQSWDVTRRVRIAQTLDFDDMLAARGASLADINRCLRDTATANRLVAGSEEDAAMFGVSASPGFVLDGEVLEGVHDWAALYPVLSERFRPSPDD